MYFKLLEKFTILTLFPLIGLLSYLKVVLGKESAIVVFFPVLIYTIVHILAQIYYSIHQSRYRPGLSYTFRTNGFVLLVLFCLFIIGGLGVAALAGGKSPYESIGLMLIYGVLFLYCLIVMNRNVKNTSDIITIINYISISMFLYVAINLAGAFLGIENPLFWEQYSREIKALAGFTEYRVRYPFTNSGQYFSIEAGLVALLGVFWWMKKPNVMGKLLGLCMLLAGVVAMLGHSARAPMLVFVFVFALVAIWRVGGRGLIKPILLFQLFFVPLIAFGGFGNILEILLNLFFDGLSRTEGDIASLSGRNVIWAVALDHLMHNENIFTILFGYGAYGQVVSGINLDYAFLFRHSYADPEAAGLHNSFLQFTIDFGVVGLFVLTMLLYMIVNYFILIQKSTLSEPIYNISKMGILLIAYLILCSTTESIISYYSMGLFSFFILFSLLSFARVLHVRDKVSYKGRC